MTDIHKIAEITGLTVKTLRRVEKAGFLKVTKSADPIADAARANIKKGNKLTALQQFYLLKNAAAVDAMPENYASEIRSILARLGDVERDAAPWEIASKVAQAARKDADAIAAVAVWMASLLDRTSGAVDHAFIAVRLLFNVPDYALETISDAMRAALWYAKANSALAGYSANDAAGSTIYKKPLDL